MKNQNLIRTAVVALAALCFAGNVHAFTCGIVSAEATAKNQNKAESLANRAAQKRTRSLDKKHGGDIEYQTPRVACSAVKAGVKCKITQRFCIDDGSGQDQPADFGGDQIDTNSPACQALDRKCKAGNMKSCAKYENTCQND